MVYLGIPEGLDDVMGLSPKLSRNEGHFIVQFINAIPLITTHGLVSFLQFSRENRSTQVSSMAAAADS